MLTLPNGKRVLKLVVKKFLISKNTYLTARIFLGFVFIVSGGLKLIDIPSFSKTVEAFAILPPGYSALFAVILPVCELVAGFGLCVGKKWGLWAVTGMLLGFIGVIGYAIYMGYDIDCGCFGPGDPEAEAFSGLKTTLLRDLFFITLSAYLFGWQKKTQKRLRRLVK